MRYLFKRSTRAVAVLFLAIPAICNAQTTHVVQVTDFAFTPKDITIQAGDTVRWENAPGGAGHNVIAEDLSFASGAVTSSWTYEHEFTEGGSFPYYCQPHRLDGMVGSVTVEGSVEPDPVAINAGHSGNWWGGQFRGGEGAQIEVSSGAGESLVFVVTFYSYGPAGGQIFLVGVGTPAEETVNVTLYITDGPVWGDGFDPADVVESEWGSGVFTSETCDLVHMTLTPNQTYQAQGYSEIAYDLIRLTTPKIACPYAQLP